MESSEIQTRSATDATLVQRLRDAYHGEVPANQEPLHLEAADEIERLHDVFAKMAASNQGLIDLRKREKRKRLKQTLLTEKWRAEAKRLRLEARLAAGEQIDDDGVLR